MSSKYNQIAKQLVNMFDGNPKLSYADLGRAFGVTRHAAKNIVKAHYAESAAKKAVTEDTRGFDFVQGHEDARYTSPSDIKVNITADTSYPLYAQQQGTTAEQVRELGDKLMQMAVSQDTEDAVQEYGDKLANMESVRELRELAQREAVRRQYTESVRSVSARVETPKLIAYNNEHSENVGLLIISDVHYGMHVPARLTSGYEYTSKDAERQFEMLHAGVVKESIKQQFRKLIILDLGDDVDGDDMRPSQHRFVGPIAVKQSVAYGRLLAQFVASLLPFVAEVQVERVSGNHARTSQKAGLGGLAEIDPASSYDWMAGEVARQILEGPIGAGRVTLTNHESIYAVTQVGDLNVLFEHGSSIRGAGGAVGVPMNAMITAVNKYQHFEGVIDVYVIGHFHNAVQFNTGYDTMCVVNGSFPPTSPYVLSAHKSIHRPSQTLMTVNDSKGVVSVSHVYLDVVRKQSRGDFENV